MSEAQGDPGTKRALAAIVFTDAVGFSALASVDEARALKLIHEDFAIMEGVCGKFGGRMVKNTGDGFLLVFGSAVEAVSCAVAIQQALQERLGDDLLAHRIGVHLGDVVFAGNDAQGDGVNVAARLQQIAPSGGVLVSRTVYDVAKGKVSVAAEYLGPKSLQNIAEPVEVYALSSGQGRRPVLPRNVDARPDEGRQKVDARWVIAGLVVIVGLLVALVVWLAGRDADRAQPVVVRRVESPSGASVGAEAGAPRPGAPRPGAEGARDAPSLRDWVLAEVRNATQASPITYSANVAGTRQTFRVWSAGTGRDITLEVNGVPTTASVDQLPPWQVRMLAVAALEQRGGDQRLVRRLIADFARQNGLPDAVIRR